MSKTPRTDALQDKHSVGDEWIESYDYCSDFYNLAETLETELAQAQEEIKRLREDAARYQYLRNSAHFVGRQKYRLEWYLPRRYTGDMAKELDDAIDAALKA